MLCAVTARDCGVRAAQVTVQEAWRLAEAAFQADGGGGAFNLVAVDASGTVSMLDDMDKVRARCKDYVDFHF